MVLLPAFVGYSEKHTDYIQGAVDSKDSNAGGASAVMRFRIDGQIPAVSGRLCGESDQFLAALHYLSIHYR